MRLPKVNHIILLISIAVLLILTGLALDNRLQITKYDIHDSRIPLAFDGDVIAQLSDMHCRVFGKDQSELIGAVKSGKPDIIMLTGDIIDANIRDYNSVSELFAGLSKIAPIYAVSGNHENYDYDILHHMGLLYKKYGVYFLNDKGISIKKDGASIFIFGANDRSFELNISKLNTVPTIDKNEFGILLYHRANEFDYVSDFGYGLVLSGHMHGGLIRLPFVGGIVTPDGLIDFNQKYTGGQYSENGTTLISNRGMAPSHGVPRLFNRPEVVFITLHRH